VNGLSTDINHINEMSFENLNVIFGHSLRHCFFHHQPFYGILYVITFIGKCSDCSIDWSIRTSRCRLLLPYSGSVLLQNIGSRELCPIT